MAFFNCVPMLALLCILIHLVISFENFHEVSRDTDEFFDVRSKQKSRTRLRFDPESGSRKPIIDIASFFGDKSGRSMFLKSGHEKRLWSSGIVPYQFDPVSPPHPLIQGKVEALMEKLQDYGCVEFRPKENETLYLNIKASDQCIATVGMIENARMEIGGSLYGFNCTNSPVLSHLLLNVLGITEDHQSLRRDEHIRVHFDRINPDVWGEFRKTPSTMDRAYEPDGIFHAPEGLGATDPGSDNRPLEHRFGHAPQYMFGPRGQDDFTFFTFHHISHTLYRIYECPNLNTCPTCKSGVLHAPCDHTKSEPCSAENRQCFCWCFVGYRGEDCNEQLPSEQRHFYDSILNKQVGESINIFTEKRRDVFNYYYIQRDPNSLHPFLSVEELVSGCVNIRWSRYDKNTVCSGNLLPMFPQRPSFNGNGSMVVQLDCYDYETCRFNLTITAVNNGCAHLKPCSPESECVDSTTENNVYQCICGPELTGKHCYEVHDRAIEDNFDGYDQYFDHIDESGFGTTCVQYPGPSPPGFNGPPHDNSTQGLYEYQIDDKYGEMVYRVGFYMLALPHIPVSAGDAMIFDTKFTFFDVTRCLRFAWYMVSDCDNDIVVSKYVKQADGSLKEKTLWVKSGPGVGWKSEAVTVPYDQEYDGYKIRFRITFSADECYRTSSVSIDDFKLLTGLCPSEDVTTTADPCPEETKSSVGSPCVTDLNCTHCGVQHSLCISEHCCCQFGYYGGIGGITCHPKIPLGGSCEKSEDCRAHTNNSVCLNNVCRCANGYYQETSLFNKQLYCAKIGGGTDCKGRPANFCNTPTAGMTCDPNKLVCVCPAGMVYVTSLNACYKAGTGVQCKKCFDSGGVCYDLDNDGTADGCECVCPMPSPSEALSTGCRRVYGELDEMCKLDGSVYCIADHSICRHEGGLSSDHTCQCKTGYVAVPTVQDFYKQKCYKSLSVYDDERCLVCVSNGGKCYDIDEDGCMDGCLCPYSRVSSEDIPSKFCDTPVVNVTCDAEVMTVCFDPTLHGFCPNANESLQNGNSLLFIRDKKESCTKVDPACQFQLTDGKWCIVLNSSDNTSCQTEKLVSRYWDLVSAWGEFRCSSKISSVFDICFYVYCKFHKIAKTSVGVMVSKQKVFTSVGRVLKPKMDMAIINEYGSRITINGLYKDVQLVAMITDDKGVYRSMKAIACVASNKATFTSPGAKSVILIRDGCPYKDAPIKGGLIFVPDSDNELMAKSNPFKLFSMGGDELYFQCCFLVCLAANADECLPDDCSSSRRRRSTSGLSISGDFNRPNTVIVTRRIKLMGKDIPVQQEVESRMPPNVKTPKYTMQQRPRVPTDRTKMKKTKWIQPQQLPMPVANEPTRVEEHQHLGIEDLLDQLLANKTMAAKPVKMRPSQSKGFTMSMKSIIIISVWLCTTIMIFSVSFGLLKKVRGDLSLGMEFEQRKDK